MPSEPTWMGQIDYASVLAEVAHSSIEAVATTLCVRLPPLWKAAYLAMAQRVGEIYVVRHASFQYVFDCEETEYDPAREGRLVVAFGRSQPQRLERDDFRLKGWLGPTEALFGQKWDKGHFIAHSIGGAVDQCELNVFVQRRDMNRGWSSAGKRFRAMEKYCFQNSSTFCFNRPVYTDEFARPAMIEFGILKSIRELWVELFDNG